MPCCGEQGVLLALVVLQFYRVSGCPDLCHCSGGKVDCYGRRYRSVPENLDEDADTVLLAYNEISDLHSMAFYKHQRLTHLELQSNALVNLHGHSFHGLNNLTYLDLSSNRLTSIKAEVFSPLPRLTTLNLGNNRLSQLPVDILRPLLNLQAFRIHNNALRGLQVDVLSGVPALTELRLDGNPWTCTCQIRHLASWMRENGQKVRDKDRTLCGGPGPLSHLPILEIKEESFQSCHDPLPVWEYVYFLLIGVTLFICSIILCFAAASLRVCYDRTVSRLRRRPRTYRHKPASAQEAVIIANPSPTCTV